MRCDRLHLLCALVTHLAAAYPKTDPKLYQQSHAFPSNLGIMKNALLDAHLRL